jgi:hypothetical protein
MLRVADRHVDRPVVDPGRHRVEQSTQSSKRVIGQIIKVRIKRHLKSRGRKAARILGK